MSSRRTLNQNSGSTNPATKFLNWKSNDKVFSYYDKEKGENIALKLPLKFQFLEDFHTVKGWHDKSESGIYSNEVKYISKEELTVKAFKGGEIATGIYTDIRSKVRDNGGVYNRSVYVVLEDGTIANIALKGSAVSAYSDFMKENSNKIEGAWMVVASAKDMKKGATKYSTPVFEIGERFTADEMKLADESYQIIATYYEGYSSEKLEAKTDEAEDYKEDEEVLF
jgi:hypothetical protein